MVDSLLKHSRPLLLREADTTTASASLAKTTATTCNTSTFQIRLNAGPNRIELLEIQSQPGGTFVIAGNTILNNNQKQGFILVLNNNGTLVQQQLLQVSGQPVVLSTIRIRRNGSIVVVGQLQQLPQQAIIASFSPSLVFNWSRTYALPAAPSKLTLDFTPEENILLAAQLAANILYTQIDQSGTPLFTRQLTVAGMQELVGFTLVLFTELILVVNCETAGRKSVYLATIHPQTGIIGSSHVSDANSHEYRYHDLTAFNGRMIAFGSKRSNTGTFSLVRNIVALSSQIETEHRYQLPGISNNFNTTITGDNAGDAIGVCDAVTGRLFLIKHFATYQISLEHVKQYAVPVGASVRSVARSFTDGGYIMGLNTAAGNELILLKTDSIGIVAGCAYQSLQVTDQEQILIHNLPAPGTASAAAINHTTANLQLSNAAIGTQTICNQPYCPPDVQLNECYTSYFKTYRSNSYMDFFGHSFPVRGNKRMLFSSRVDRVLGNELIKSGGIRRLTEKGIVEKGGTVFFDGASARPAAYERIDSQHVIAMFYSLPNGVPHFTFSKINDEMQVVWTVSYRTFDNYFYSSSGMGSSLCTDAQGNIYFTGTTLGSDGFPRLLVMKLNSQGQQQWLKIHQTQSVIFQHSTAVTTNSRLVIVIEGDNASSTSVCIDKESGVLLQSFRFNHGAGGSLYRRTLALDGSRIFLSFTDNQGQLLLAVFDTTARPLHIRYSPGLIGPPRVGAVQNGKFYVLGSYFNGANIDDVLFRVDSTLTPDIKIRRSWLRNTFFSDMQVAQNGSIYVTGNHYHGGVNSNYMDPFIQKMEPDGKLGSCVTEVFPNDLVSLPLVLTPLSYTTTSNQFTLVPTFPVVIVDDQFMPKADALLCSGNNSCTSVKLTGPSPVCGVAIEQVFKTEKPAGCLQRPRLKFDTAFVNLITQTDTSVTVRFKKTGTTRLYLELNNGCKLFVDSMDVQVIASPPAVQLGKDTVLCPGTNIILQAPAGYQQYRWQDLSTASSYTVTKPGTYYVTALNACGQVSTDTIVISGAIVPSLFIGRDSAVCLRDTLQLRADAGFSNYTWKGQGLLATQGPVVRYLSLANSVVSVVAVTAEGCLAHDTIQLTVISARPFSLGNDTSFCRSDSLILRTAVQYSKYQWSTGSQAPAITVFTPGSYSLMVTDANGCRVADTMRVLAVFDLPVVSLGADFNICAGDTRRLDAGAFSRYLWQDGSTNRFFNATTVGRYWVTVTNATGCKAADTVTLLNRLPKPADFLPPLDSVCQLETKTITPLRNFQAYQWSTGSSQRSLVVEKAGWYILRVQDANGCAGTDSILVKQRACRKGVYVPTAFTPNNDGLNDDFRAAVFGQVKYFQLEVFNRFGQLVFRTNDPLKGWDGIFNRQPQDPAVFVWKCSYLYDGEVTQHLSGTVTLIR